MEVIDVTLNPNDMGSGNTLSNGNLTVTGATTTGIRATHGKISGKWYWEVKLDAGDTRFLIGASNKSLSLSSFNTSYLTTSWRGFNFSNGNRLPENTSYGVPSIVGNIIGIALDLDNGTVEFYKNGVSLGISHTNIKELGEIYPTAGRTASFSTTATFNFGQTPFMYEIPKKFYSYDGRQYGGSNKILLSSEGKVYSAISYDPIDVIPTMTSNTAPSGTVSASSASTSGTEYRVFDKNKTNTWLTTSGQKTGWIQYKFPSMARVNRYGITPQSNALTRSPKKWSLLGSNTGLFNGEEVVLDSRINETSWSAGTKYFDFNNNSEYQYYRLSIEENNGDTSYVGFNELEFLQRADMKLVKLSSPSEKNFIQYGSSTVQFGNLTSMVDVNDSGRDLGSGKNFEHTIDMSKRRVDKITLG